MTPEDLERRLAWAKRTRDLAENLMLRQMPGDVSERRAEEVVDAAVAFYAHLERRLVEDATDAEEPTDA